MDRGTNRKGNYRSQRDYILNEAAERSKQYLPSHLKPLAKEVVEAILTSQYKELNKKAHTLSELEISGLGRFILRLRKTKNTIAMLERTIAKYEPDPDYPRETIEKMKVKKGKLEEKLKQYYEFENSK